MISENTPEPTYKAKCGFTGFDNVYYRHSIKYFESKIDKNDTYRVFPLGVDFQIQTLWQVRAPRKARVYFEAMWKALVPYNCDLSSALNGYSECREVTKSHMIAIQTFLKDNFVFEKPEGLPEGEYPKDWEVLYFIRLNPLKTLSEIPQRLIEAAKSRNNGEHAKVIDEYLKNRQTHITSLAAK